MSKRITELPASTAATSDDLLAIVNDPGGSPATQKIVFSDLLGNIPATMKPTTDNSPSLGAADKRWANVISAIFDRYGAAGDANPTIRLGASGLQFGAGGATAPDILLSRGAADRLDLASGDILRLISGLLESGTSFTITPASGSNLDLAVAGAGGVQVAGTTVFESDRDVAISLIPNASGLDLGSASRLWDAFLQSLKLDLGSDATGDIYYRNSGGQVTRLGIGSTDQVLKVSGGLPVWAAATGNANGTIHFPAGAAIIPLSGQASQALNDGTNLDYISLDFDAAVDESVFFQGVMPRDYDGGNIEFELQWFAAATTGTVKWVVDGRNLEAGVVVDGSFTNMATFDGTPAGTTNQIVYTSVTSVTELTGLAAGEMFMLKLTRNADDAGDTMSGDAKVIGLTIRYTRA